ncbi:MAG: histidine phosphatase family protein [Alphaproteobacteria bacterium]|nr:histidine phosphatase family protein [Alphaproteobacteria bacterium]
MLETRAFYYLRHGETDWNRSGCSQGRSDISLNETGRAQARTAAEPLASCGIATICCSPLRRARETAEIVNRRLGVSIVKIDDLIECNWGVGEGQVQGAWYHTWRDGGYLEGAEPYADFIERALGGINEALQHPGPVLIVGHGGVYRAIKTHARLDMGFSLANSVPVRHDPPRTDSPRWTATEIEPC